MNQSFLNPFSTPSIPESVHQVLGPRTEVQCHCARFNPRGLFAGQYIASARSDWTVAIYDVETQGMIRLLQGHVKPVTAIAWSDSGRFLASASSDWNVVLWDLKSEPASRVRTIRFDGPVASVDFAPRCR
jgi:COMPASS component SWD1